MQPELMAGCDARERLAAHETDAFAPAVLDAAAAGAAATLPQQDPLARLFRPPSNCWRVDSATRVSFLIDNAAYFAAARHALLHARHSIFLLGWNFDHRTLLTPAEPGSDPIGRLLLGVARERPELHVRLLVWAVTPVIAALSHGMPWRAWWRFHGTRVRCALDDTTPLGAAHHQKVLVIDDEVAFCSGSDFMCNRWDRIEHADRDECRRLPSGTTHPPRHALTVMLDGSAAASLGILARDRWLRATGEAVEPAQPHGARIWPDHIAPDVQSVPVAIARTYPHCARRDAVHEVEALFIDAICAARHSIYIENQYFASERVADAIVARLAEADPPEIVGVCSAHAPNAFDRLTMDPARNRVLQRIRDADRHRRFALYAPYTAQGSPIVVHSKVMIVDDRIVRVGSANLNNRSLGFDSECDVAILGGEHAMARLRTRLISHFIDCPPDMLERAVAQTGSIIGAIEALDRGSRLRRVPAQQQNAWRSAVARYHIGDPHGPDDAWRPWKRR